MWVKAAHSRSPLGDIHAAELIYLVVQEGRVKCKKSLRPEQSVCVGMGSGPGAVQPSDETLCLSLLYSWDFELKENTIPVQGAEKLP